MAGTDLLWCCGEKRDEKVTRWQKSDSFSSGTE